MRTGSLLLALRRLAPLLFAPLLLAPAAWAADPPTAGEVDRAIQSGVAWLVKEGDAGEPHDRLRATPELVLLTFAHAHVGRQEKAFAERLEAVEGMEPRFTYRTALMAMALAEINPGLYRTQLAHCAQWLVDTQLPGGEWGYPGTSAGPGWKPEGEKVPPPPSESVNGPEGGKRPARVLILRRSSATAAMERKGDFSNTQFAILGLRACRDAGIDVPKETWKAALSYLEKFQHEDGGWGYVIEGVQDEGPYASLTAAGACSTAITLDALGTKDVKGAPGVKKALAWLARRFDPAQNAGIDTSSVRGPSPWQCYHLYSVERAARVLGLKQIGKRDWYAEGARALLAAQKPDGRWSDFLESTDPHARAMDVGDTCFALLFLTRSTRPITRGS